MSLSSSQQKQREQQQEEEEESKSNNVIKYYMDADRNEPAPTDNYGNLSLKFGTVVQGDSKRIRIYAYNNIDDPIQLEPVISGNDPDLKITTYPNILRVGETAPVDITFSPDLDRIKPLKTTWDFRKIILTSES